LHDRLAIDHEASEDGADGVGGYLRAAGILAADGDRDGGGRPISRGAVSSSRHLKIHVGGCQSSEDRRSRAASVAVNHHVLYIRAVGGGGRGTASIVRIKRGVVRGIIDRLKQRVVLVELVAVLKCRGET